MNTRSLFLLIAALGLLAVMAGGRAQDNPPAQDGVEVLARGPVHEAYAQPADGIPEAAPVVAQEPPAPIDELPPEQKPEGDEVVWIPGYWAWDEESTEFVWVSGFWRDAPPDRVWVPGHWQKVSGGWQWTSGFWQAEEQEQVQYVPPPPEPIDRGPSTPAPEAESVYVPGCWVWQTARFYWRPGFWLPFRPGWVWVPAHYVWTPGGFVFVEGYWDAPLHARGLLFAPVRFTRVVERTVFVPTYTVRHDFLLSALFVRPTWRSYYFGDYFERRYVDRGFVPWVDYHPHRAATVFDMNFNYYRHRFATARTWEENLRTLYRARFEGNVSRPPHTLVQQTQVLNNINQKNIQNTIVNQNINITNVQNVQVLAPVNQVNNTRVTSLASLAGPKAEAIREDVRQVVRVQPVSKEQRQTVQKAATQFHEVARQRQQAEAKLAAAEAAPARSKQPAAVKLDVARLSAAARATEPGKAAPPPKPKRAREAPPVPQVPRAQQTPSKEEPPPKGKAEPTPVPVPKGKKDEPVPPKDKKDDRPPVPKPKDKADEPAPVPKPKDKKDEPPPPKGKKDDRPPEPKPKDKKDEPPPPKAKKDEPPVPPPPAPVPKPKDKKDEPPPPKGKKDDKPPAGSPQPPPQPAPMPKLKPKEKEKDKKDND